MLAWAVVATALALVSVGYAGYAMGRKSTATIPALASAPRDSRPVDTSGREAPAQPIDPYQVPAALAGLPAEWHSVPGGEDSRGYAILFDPQRREVIVEKCLHPGYVDPRSGDLIELSWEFCEGVLWGSLTRIDERSATVIARAGDAVELAFAVEGEGGSPRLSLSFADHEMLLTPGSKNDYFQLLENSPAMRVQKDTYIKTMVAREQAERRAASDEGGR